jgi:hypothetical protein
VLDRASTFARKGIVQLLQTRFVPVAIDQAYQRRQKDAEGDFYRKIAGQGPRNNFKGTTQGFYAAGPDGKLLFYNNNRNPERVEGLMRKALRNYRPTATTAIARGKPDARYNPLPPNGGLVVRVRAKILSGYPETTDPWKRIFQTAISRDNLWISKSEHAALASGSVPKTVQQRIARYHLVDNTRGEPPMWKADEIRHLDMKITGGKLTGTVRLATASGDRTYEADLYGVVKTSAGKVTRFDLIAKGNFSGEGTYTRGAPKGKFPLAIAFTLADGRDAADAVPPQASRGWVRGYIK